ncbi:MAG: sulfatase [Candidatus Aminicenantes bacterium]|nr:sulfatase [Candidatus Aminicenantes bacterium]
MLVTAAWTCGCSRSNQPRNLLLIVSDALRMDMLGCYGGPAHTPHINRLAREGTLFENAYCTAPTTMPSAVTMLTGCYSRTFTFDHRTVYLDYLDKRVPSAFFRVGDGAHMLAEAMSEAGVDTRVSMENGLVRICNLLQGFSRLPGKKQLPESRRRKIREKLGFQEESLAYEAMYGTLDYLLHSNPEQPFFLFKWIFDPHSPYDPAPRFRAPVDAGTVPLPHPGTFYSDFKNAALRAKLDNNRMSAAERNYVTALYRAEVESVDDRVGAILKALDAGGRRNRTLVVFTSDHGECLGDYGMYGHGRGVHPPLVRVPLIYSGPGIPKGQRVKTVISHLDLTPTLAELLKVQKASPMQGVSYTGIFRGKQLPDREVYFDYFSNLLDSWTRVDGMLSEGFQLVVDRRQGDPEFHLFDLSADPAAMKEVAAAHTATVRRLFAQLQVIRRKNRLLLLEHAGLVRGDLDPATEREKARKLLQTLGYL